MIPQLVRLRSPQVHFGSMLLELLIALAVATLAIVGLVSLTTRSISNAGYSKRQSTATAYASQAMEWIRSEKNADWQVFSAHSGTYCLNSLTWTVHTSCTAKTLDSNTFSREVVLTAPTAQQIQAVVTVKWRETGTHDFSINQTTIFSRY